MGNSQLKTCNFPKQLPLSYLLPPPPLQRKKNSIFPNCWSPQIPSRRLHYPSPQSCVQSPSVPRISFGSAGGDSTGPVEDIVSLASHNAWWRHLTEAMYQATCGMIFFWQPCNFKMKTANLHLDNLRPEVVNSCQSSLSDRMGEGVLHPSVHPTMLPFE